jgi:type I restriction enzyme R subunit
MLYRKKFFPAEHFELTGENGAKTRQLIREHIDVEEIRRDFPTYVLDENYLTKIKEKLPDAKALEIEATLTAELKIRLEQDEEFRPLSERLQRLIDQKRAGALAGIALIALIEELEKLTGEDVAAIEETKRPVAQTIALSVKERVGGVSDEKAVEIAAAILGKADELCFEGWEHRPDMETTLTREFTLLLADRYRDLGLIGTGKDFVARCVRLLKRSRYRGGRHAA